MYNHVILLNDEKGVEYLCSESSVEACVLHSQDKRIAIIGTFPETLLDGFDYYDATQDWQTEVDWKDASL